jgi:hypothetical protein
MRPRTAVVPAYTKRWVLSSLLTETLKDELRTSDSNIQRGESQIERYSRLYCRVGASEHELTSCRRVSCALQSFHPPSCRLRRMGRCVENLAWLSWVIFEYYLNLRKRGVQVLKTSRQGVIDEPMCLLYFPSWSLVCTPVLSS